MNGEGPSPAEQSTEVLRRLGIPPEAIETLLGRNTAEEMISLGSRFADLSRRVGLLTSAWHLPRAMRLARRNGFEPHPLPSDFLLEPFFFSPAKVLQDCIPNGLAFDRTARITKETLDRTVGR